jgi:hypothetical protein
MCVTSKPRPWKKDKMRGEGIGGLPPPMSW